MKNKLFTFPVIGGVICFVIHFLVGLFLLKNFLKLIVVIHIFLMLWSVLYMFSLQKIRDIDCPIYSSQTIYLGSLSLLFNKVIFNKNIDRAQ